MQPSRWSVTGLFLAVFICQVACQVPPRLQIPGAVPVGGARPSPFGQSRPLPGPRLRRPNALPSAVREVRPVVEDIEEPNYPSPSPTSAFDEEVNKLSLSLQSARDEEEERAAPLPFRPERPVPIAREQIREKSVINRPPPPPPRPVIREENIPLRPAPVRQVSRPVQSVPAQSFRGASPKLQPRQQLEDDDDDRRRKPVPEILRKYRNDNEDGSITWGYEIDDGSFKEETLGADCIIRGKYGYVDPDGVKREFSYETGNKCDEPEPDEEEEFLSRKQQNISQPKGNKPLPYRVAAQPQYVN